MSRKRFIVECEWSGYYAHQRHIVHRHVTTMPNLYKHIHSVIFIDGTDMSVKVRACKPREKVIEQIGYKELLDKISAKGLTGTISVQDL